MKPTLGQVFALSLLGLATVLVFLFVFVFGASHATIIESSERLREEASREISERVTAFLAQAPAAVDQFQFALDHGLVDPHQLDSIEPALFAPMLSSHDIGEVTLTYGEKIGSSPDGDIQLAPAPRGQWSIVRTTTDRGEDHFWSRHVHEEGHVFIADRREFGKTPHFGAQPFVREPASVPDPTTHDTFTSPANDANDGDLLWSDLHWSQFTSDLPEAQRSAEVSVQQVVKDAAGHFVGVLRVGLLTRQLDRAVRIQIAPEGTADPHRIFLCDADGRLVTRLSPADHLSEIEDNLRITSNTLPPEVQRALSDPASHSVSEGSQLVSGHFRLRDEEFLTTFRALPDTQDWMVGIVVPRSYYLGKLTGMRDRMLLVSLGIMLLLVASGALILRAVKRAHARIAHESSKMNRFDFSPAPAVSPFRDVGEVLESLEKAKTAMRAMGKYVPVDLVRRLYRDQNEPVLGGEAMDISIMFTDIKDFTSMSETLDPDILARALGRYLEAMARIIQQETHGTIDKYIGDAIMTIWNAPGAVADHARMACTAALRCRDAARDLAKSPDWENLPPFETRFGLHAGIATVGHFGAPDRMNYTAIGDSVNLASRLEGLNKQYGTSIIVSESIVEEARDLFAFRRLDRVAVKGRNRAITIYELLGHREEAHGWTEAVHCYEHALDRYAAGDFAAAAEILEKRESDPPSAVLAARCRAFIQEPPPPGWDGVAVMTTK